MVHKTFEVVPSEYDCDSVCSTQPGQTVAQQESRLFWFKSLAPPVHLSKYLLAPDG